jgi:hypothetical protein
MIRCRTDAGPSGYVILVSDDQEEMAVDPQEPNCHLDGTPHVDYSTLIHFCVAGHFKEFSEKRAK